jgi:hypothetical protein
MRKKIVTVSHLPHRLLKKRILLSRETIRTLTSGELTQAVGAAIKQLDCPTGSQGTNPDDI